MFINAPKRIKPVDQQPTVWVVQENSKINLAPAVRYGNIEFLLDERSDILNARAIIPRLRQKLTPYKHGDYVLAIGDPAAIGIVTALVSEISVGRFTMLKWDKQDRLYIPVHVDMNGE